MGRVFAVEDEQRPALDRGAEQLAGHQLLVVAVDGLADVAAVVLVLEAAVDDHLVIVVVVVLAVEDVEEGAALDAGNAVAAALGEEMGAGWGPAVPPYP